MKTPSETARSLRVTIGKAMQAAAHIEAWKLQYVDINVTAEPGEPELFKERGCNGEELLALLDAFATLSGDIATDRLKLKLDAVEALVAVMRETDKADWVDRPDEHTAEIVKAVPYGDSATPADHKRYELALKMVHNRNGKYELVDLVNWLLCRIAKAEELPKKEVANGPGQ